MSPVRVAVRIVVADDHPLMLRAVAAQLDSEDDITVLATADTCEGLVTVITQHTPDVAVADMSMPDGSTLDVLERIAAASPATRVLLLSATDSTADIATALERGAAGFLSKNVDPGELARHVREVAGGGTVLDRVSAAAVVAQLRRPAPQAPLLSDRETQVIGLVAAGLSNRDIGERLFVSLSTVKTHLERAFDKLSVTDRASAVAKAKDLGLI